MINLKDMLSDIPKAKHLIIMDADWLVMNAMTASIIDEDWGDGMWVYGCDHNKAMDILKANLKNLTSRKAVWAKDSTVVMCWSSRPNFRADLYPEYKGNRKAVRKPAGFDAFVDRVIDELDILHISEPRLEADDVMGILGSNPKAFGYDESIIISVDKDFKTIPNTTFFNVNSGSILKQDEFYADWWHMYQAICGDMVDNYKGIPNMGDKGAEELLDDPYKLERTVTRIAKGKNAGKERIVWKRIEKSEDDTIWDCMVSVAAREGVSEEELILQAQLARILRFDDYDIEKGVIHLWSPY